MAAVVFSVCVFIVMGLFIKLFRMQETELRDARQIISRQANDITSLNRELALVIKHNSDGQNLLRALREQKDSRIDELQLELSDVKKKKNPRKRV